MLWATWWVWIAGAIALGILEMLAPGFIFVGFAVGAAAIGLLLLIGVTPSLPWILVLFAAISLVTWLVLRRVIGVRKGQSKRIEIDINEL